MPNPVITDASLTALARLLLQRAEAREAEPGPQPLGELLPEVVERILDRTKTPRTDPVRNSQP